MRKSLPIFYSALLLTAVNLLLRFVSTSFQVHISARIGAEGIGLLQLVLSVGGLALTAGIGGIRTATMYLTAEELGRNNPQNITWVLRGCFLYSLVFSILISTSLHIFAPWIAEHWIGAVGTAGAIRMFATFLPLVCLTGCMTGYFTAANRITTLAGIEILEQLCYMAVTLTALNVWAGNDPEKACQAVVFGSGISSCLALMLLFMLRFKEHAKIGPPIPVARRLAVTALPLALADDLRAGISTTENLMVPKRLAQFPGEVAPLATFGTVVGMVFPVLMFPAAILFALAELLIPELARCNAAGSSVRIRYLVQKGLRVALLYGALCGGLMFLLAHPLCKALYGASEAGIYLRRYSLLAPMLYCDAITDAMTKGLGQQRICVRYNILTSVLDVLLLFIFLPKYGMQGYFVSFFITHLINFLLSIRRLVKISKIKIPFYIPAMILSAAVISVMMTDRMNSIITKTIIYLLLFGCLLMLMGILGKQDIRWIKKLITKDLPRFGGRSEDQSAFKTSNTNS